MSGSQPTKIHLKFLYFLFFKAKFFTPFDTCACLTFLYLFLWVFFPCALGRHSTGGFLVFLLSFVIFTRWFISRFSQLWFKTHPIHSLKTTCIIMPKGLDRVLSKTSASKVDSLNVGSLNRITALACLTFTHLVRPSFPFPYSFLVTFYYAPHTMHSAHFFICALS